MTRARPSTRTSSTSTSSRPRPARKQYAQHWQETLLATGQGAQLESFTPANVAGAVGLRVADKLGSTGVVIFAKGPYAVRAVVNGGPNVDQSGPASDLASQQYQQLPVRPPEARPNGVACGAPAMEGRGAKLR